MNTLLENIFNYLKSYYLEILNLILTIILLIFMIISINQENLLKASDNKFEYVDEKVNKQDNSNALIRVDIKGAVKKPGVYSLNDDSIINDVIKAAGGLTRNASTENINLSKQLKNEMVIYVSTKNQLKKRISNSSENNTNKINNLTKESIVETNSEEVKGTGVENISTLKEERNENEEKTSKKVNINTCSKEDLLTLNGVGESKAEKIIEYRKLNGLFKTIEDIKNVSGIGDSAFEKIKDYITI